VNICEQKLTKSHYFFALWLNTCLYIDYQRVTHKQPTEKWNKLKFYPLISVDNMSGLWWSMMTFEPGCKTMNDETLTFKVLRVADPSTIGGTKPISVSNAGPKPVHFVNAVGGLRMGTIAEIRQCAAASAHRTKARLG
jgi:hypothetical protein